MHGLARIEDAGRTPLKGSLVIFERYPQLLYVEILGPWSCKALVGGGLGLIDGFGGPGQLRRLSLTPSWWYRPFLPWIDVVSAENYGRPSLVNKGMHRSV